MSKITAMLRDHPLWVGFVGALVPLIVLLGLQISWLVKLQRVSAIAHRASLHNYLEAIATEVEYFYRSTAERALNVPASALVDGCPDKVANYWRKKPVKGIKRLFLVDFTREPLGNHLAYDSGEGVLRSPPASDEALAIVIATTPWQMLSYRGGKLESSALSVDERNPQYRIVLNPITDDSGGMVGIAGMILDEDFFRKRLLPGIIDKALPQFFSGSARDQLRVMVQDGRANLVLGSPDPGPDGETVRRTFKFVYGDWTLGLHSPRSAPEQWARTGFAFNATVSVLLGLVLVGGLVLAMRAANRAMKLSQMKADFVSNVSHELRTPLASIRVFAELLRLGRVGDRVKVREYGEYIEAESRRLTRLINNILDFARIESGQKAYRFVPSDVSQVVAVTLEAFDVRLKHDGFRLHFDKPAGPLPSVDADADALGQAIHNLLDNAVKYSGDSRDIRVRLGCENGSVIIEVEDHGIGIAPDEQRRIFERFHRVGTGLIHDVRGSGLGLSLVHHIVDAHRGRVTVESEQGKGSTFRIHLPLGSGAGLSGAEPAPAGDRAAGLQADQEIRG